MAASLTERDIQDLLDVRHNLRTDSRNRRRRERYRERNRRWCLGCESVELTGSYARPPCARRRDFEQRDRVRYCLGSHGQLCDIELSGSGKRRCEMHQLLRLDELREARNQRRRKIR